jgi:hypothetical protein
MTELCAHICILPFICISIRHSFPTLGSLNNFSHFCIIPLLNRMSSSSSDSPDLVSAKKKIDGVINYESLPKAVDDPLWVDIKKEAILSLGELGALKNARCIPSNGK